MNGTNQDKIWELAAAKTHNEADSAEAGELEQMIQQVKYNEEVFTSVDKIYEELTATHPLQYGSVYRSWEQVSRYFKKKKIRFYLNMSKYAAIMLLAFGLGTLINHKWKPAPEILPVFTEIFVPLGQMSEMKLSDGTQVWLNSGTTLRYSGQFGDQAREVILEGEAFFKVKSSEIPFKVKIKDKIVEVLGTSFAAVAYPDEDFSQVTLVEGLVQVNEQAGRFLKIIDPNQMLHIPDDPKKKISIYEVSPLFYQSWIEGQIRFDEERLADVARRLERWYNVEIRFASKEAGNWRFTGTVLKNKPVDQSIQAMSMLLPINVEYENNLATKDVITISKK